MSDILDMPIHQLAGISFDCDCGMRHSVDIKQILVGHGALEKITETISMLGAQHACLIADSNTQYVAGARAAALLAAAKIPYHTILFPQTERLVPNEAALGHILAEMEPEDDLLLAVGSGTLNDLARLVSMRTRIPYVIVATAPSMDGYASTVSPLILAGKKITKPGVYPAAIVADTGIMKDAPTEMLTAGYGDIIGKFTSDADWRLSHIVNNENYCSTCAGLVNRAVHKCAENGKELKQRDENAVKYLTEALILSGVAMGLYGNSRPASGAEHHFSHYWEVDALSKGQEHSLHGNSVAVGALLSASLYELAKAYLPQGFEPPDKAQIKAVISLAGGPVHPKEIGIDRELFRRSILHAMEIRERYTILRFCDQRGLLKGFANQLTAQYFG